MNSIIKSLSDGNLVRKYELDILSESNVELFLPLTYEILSEEKGEACFSICSDISNMNPAASLKDEGEAPYIVSGLISGMEDAMFHYILPWHYRVEKSLLYFTKKRYVRLVYEPTKALRQDIDIPGKVIRSKSALLMRELFADMNRKDYSDEEKNGIKSIPQRVISYLEDPSISYEVCKRRIEKLKEEVYFLDPDRGSQIS